MAIDSTNERLALINFGQVWQPALPIAPGALGQDDQQQLLWGYPGILWGAPAATEVFGRRHKGRRLGRKKAHEVGYDEWLGKPRPAAPPATIAPIAEPEREEWATESTAAVEVEFGLEVSVLVSHECGAAVEVDLGIEIACVIAGEHAYDVEVIGDLPLLAMRSGHEAERAFSVELEVAASARYMPDPYLTRPITGDEARRVMKRMI